MSLVAGKERLVSGDGSSRSRPAPAELEERTHLRPAKCSLEAKRGERELVAFK